MIKEKISIEGMFEGHGYVLTVEIMQLTSTCHFVYPERGIPVLGAVKMHTVS